MTDQHLKDTEINALREELQRARLTIERLEAEVGDLYRAGQTATRDNLDLRKRLQVYIDEADAENPTGRATTGRSGGNRIMSNTLVGEMLVGRVGFGESFQACSASYSCTEDAMARSIVRLECEADELRAEVAMLKGGMVMLAQERDEARKLLAEARDKIFVLRKQRAIARNFGEQMERERDEARVQFRSVEALGMALVKTIEELKTEKADLFVQLVNLKAGSRRSTLDEIAESVREKYDERHEGEGIEN